MATRYATNWRADSALARCSKCGAQKQFHGRPNFQCTDFTAETAGDIEPGDLQNRDLVLHASALMQRRDKLSGNNNLSDSDWDDLDQMDARLKALRTELNDRIKAVFGTDAEDVAAIMETV